MESNQEIESLKDTLTLILEQQVEIFQLKKELEELKQTYAEAQKQGFPLAPHETIEGTGGGS